MSSQSEARNDTIRVPQRLTAVHVEALAMQQAQRKARRQAVVDLQLGDSRPTDGDEFEWSFSYRLMPRTR